MLGRTGTFCAMFTVLEQFKVDQVVDVLQTVKLLRIKRPGIVEDLVSSLSCSYVRYKLYSCILFYYNDLTTMCASQDQYQFIFTVVVRFLQSFDTYDNFKT